MRWSIDHRWRFSPNIAKIEADIQQGIKELEEMLK